MRSSGILDLHIARTMATITPAMAADSCTK
jgi:hypothetical protein